MPRIKQALEFVKQCYAQATAAFRRTAGKDASADAGEDPPKSGRGSETIRAVFPDKR
jgi:hypothetical protein